MVETNERSYNEIVSLHYRHLVARKKEHIKESKSMEIKSACECVLYGFIRAEH